MGNHNIKKADKTITPKTIDFNVKAPLTLVRGFLLCRIKLINLPAGIRAIITIYKNRFGRREQRDTKQDSMKSLY
jgi:hypothetical protein